MAERKAEEEKLLAESLSKLPISASKNPTLKTAAKEKREMLANE